MQSETFADIGDGYEDVEGDDERDKSRVDPIKGRKMKGKFNRKARSLTSTKEILTFTI